MLQEGEHARDDRDVAVVGETGRDPHAGLLGEADIEEALGELVPELDEGRSDVGGEDPQVLVLVAELGERGADDRSGREDLSEVKCRSASDGLLLERR